MKITKSTMKIFNKDFYDRLSFVCSTLPTKLKLKLVIFKQLTIREKDSKISLKSKLFNVNGENYMVRAICSLFIKNRTRVVRIKKNILGNTSTIFR